MTASLTHHFISGRMRLGNMRPCGHIVYVQTHDFYKCVSQVKLVSIFLNSICQMPRHLQLWAPTSLFWSPEISLVNRLTPFAIRTPLRCINTKYRIVTSTANSISLALAQQHSPKEFLRQIVFLSNFLHDRKLLFGELFRHMLCLQEQSFIYKFVI